MSIVASDEAPRAPERPDARFTDAVTFAFGDPEAELYGLARVGLTAAGASGLAVAFSGAQSVAASAEGAVAVAPGGWEAIHAAGVRTAVEDPLRAWTVSYAGDGAGFDLRFEARSAPAVLAADHAAARTGGMEGYEQPCAVTGTVHVGDDVREVACLGQRGHLWGAPDWERIELARTVSAWLGDDRALTLTAVRPAKARSHLDEDLAAWIVQDGEPLAVPDPRLSTEYDADRRQRRAGLELWMDDEDGFARRAAGEVLCGTTLDLGRLRLDAAFFAWRMEGRTGVGRYDILRRVDGD